MVTLLCWHIDIDLLSWFIDIGLLIPFLRWVLLVLVMLNNLLRASHTSIGYVPTTPSPSFPLSSPSLDKKSSTKGMLVPSTTTTATNYETWIKTIEVLLRSSFPYFTVHYFASVSF